jgi:hypothetical protein
LPNRMHERVSSHSPITCSRIRERLLLAGFVRWFGDFRSTQIQLLVFDLCTVREQCMLVTFSFIYTQHFFYLFFMMKDYTTKQRCTVLHMDHICQRKKRHELE